MRGGMPRACPVVFHARCYRKAESQFEMPRAWRLCENSVIRSSVGLEGGYSPRYSDCGAIDQFSPICLV